MISRTFHYLFLTALFGFPLVRAAVPPPLAHGEGLTYRVSWAIVPGAGEIQIAAHHESTPDGPRLVVSQSTSTRRFARMLLPFKAEAKSIFDLQTGRLLTLHEKSVTRSKEAEHRVTFDYERRVASYVNLLAPKQPVQLLPMPPGDPTDLMVGLLQTRTWNLEPGQKRDILILFDDDFYELTIYRVRHEDVQTPAGKFRTVVLEPRMEKTPPKGMFKRGSSVRIWIAQNDHRLPVKFEVEFKIGKGTAVLESYQPPVAAKRGGAESRTSASAAGR